MSKILSLFTLTIMVVAASPLSAGSPFPTPRLIETYAVPVLAGEMFEEALPLDYETVTFYNPQAHLKNGKVVLHVQSGWDGGGCPRPYFDGNHKLHFNRDQVIAFKPTGGPNSPYVPHAYDGQGDITIDDFRNSRLTPCIEYWTFGLGSVTENLKNSGYAMFFDYGDARLETNNDDKFRWIYMAQSSDGVFPDQQWPNWKLVLDSTPLDIDIVDLTVKALDVPGSPAHEETYWGYFRFGWAAQWLGLVELTYNHQTEALTVLVETSSGWREAVDGVLDFTPRHVLWGLANDIVIPPDGNDLYDLVFFTKTVPLSWGGGCGSGVGANGKAIAYISARNGLDLEALGNYRILYSYARAMPRNSATGVMFPALISLGDTTYHMFTSYDTECNGSWADLDIWFSTVVPQ